MGIPGKPPLAPFFDPDKSIHTLVVSGSDADLMIRTNRNVLTHRMEDVLKGIQVLRTITGVSKMILAVPENFLQGYGKVGAEIKTVPLKYPSAFPHLMMQNLLGQTVPAGKSCEDLGVSFFTAEAAASLGVAFTEGRIPTNKTLTVTKKDGSQIMVEACIGTPLGHVLTSLGIEVQNKDRIIHGGPMTGTALFSEKAPVLPDTDGIMVQNGADIALTSDDPCINCGECVRICPAKIPVNMLVRFLEAGQYEEAADLYDLYCCIECGLCSYVCVSRMPIFQYIRLGKYELGRMNDVEANHA
jgi:electron transport complex protein RnfC